MRTRKRFASKHFPLLLLLMIILIVILINGQRSFADVLTWPNQYEEANKKNSWPEIADINASAWIVIDLSDGSIILAHNEQEQVYPASTTKIMTALTVLEDPSYSPMKILTASEEAVDLSWDSSKIYLQAGETITMHDALAGLMIASGNDAANVLAESIAGSVPEFSRKMTINAINLGAENTSFMNPHGLHDENHYTTAEDMAIIARAAMNNMEFRELVAAPYYSLPSSNKHSFNGWNTMINTNRLMFFADSYLYSPYVKDVIGIKTGSTSAAGLCLVSAAVTHDDRELLSVIMGVPYTELQGNSWTFSRSLLEEAARQIEAPAVSYEDYVISKGSEDLLVDQPRTDQTANKEISEPTNTEASIPVSPDKNLQESDAQEDAKKNEGLVPFLKNNFYFLIVIIALLTIVLLLSVQNAGKNKQIKKLLRVIRKNKLP